MPDMPPAGRRSEMKMAPNENKDPIGNLMDKLRSHFGFGDRSKDKGGLPPKTRFSIWYFVVHHDFFFICSNSLFPGKWKQFPTANLNNTSIKGVVAVDHRS
jgi:hypothetical protein